MPKSCARNDFISAATFAHPTIFDATCALRLEHPIADAQAYHDHGSGHAFCHFTKCVPCAATSGAESTATYTSSAGAADVCGARAMPKSCARNDFISAATFAHPTIGEALCAPRLELPIGDARASRDYGSGRAFWLFAKFMPYATTFSVECTTTDTTSAGALDVCDARATAKSCARNDFISTATLEHPTIVAALCALRLELTMDDLCAARGHGYGHAF